MSHAVVRGQPSNAQKYMDRVLDDLLSAKGVRPDVSKREGASIAETMFHCMKANPHRINMINGITGEIFTNELILKQSVAIAQSLSDKCPKGKTVMVVMRNHQRMLATYWGTMFAGVLPFMMDPNTTVYELSYFLNLIEPHHVFCDHEHFEDLKKAMENMINKPSIVIANEESTLNEFITGFNGVIENFQVSESLPETSVLLLPTSGSTGFPKATLMTNRGLVDQIPTTWAYHTQFPTPTKMVMLLTTGQWMTFTMLVTSCVLYQVPLLISPGIPTVEHVTEMLEKFRPTWTFFGPAFAKHLVISIRPDQLSSLQTVIFLGAPAPCELMAEFKEKLPKTAHLCDGYGTTETQGFIAIPDKEAPSNSNGRVCNILHYKLIDDNGIEVKPGNSGELCVKGQCVIKGYYRNKDSYNESYIDGWYHTGDWFHLDVNQRLYFLERKKFSFKFKGCQVAPEEVEAIINSVDGVHESVVCATDSGPAAAIVLHADCSVSREQIHDAVNSKLSDHKRLHGGLVIVNSLPHTHSGKLQRAQCKELIYQMIKEGQCY